MNRLRKWRESRKPVEFIYEVPKMASAAEALLRHSLFVSTCLALDLSITRTAGTRITVVGQARNVAAFQRRMAVTA